MKITALPSKQSGRNVYHVVVKLSELDSVLTNSVNDGSDLIHQYQRPLIPKKVDQFCEYLRTRIKNKQPFTIPSLIGCFLPDDKVTFENGQLTIPDGFKFSCPDGQHRLEGVKQLIEAYPNFVGEQETGITIFECSSFKDRQQMFSDINSNSKSVSKAQALEFNHTSGDANFAKNIRAKVTLFDDFCEKDLSKSNPTVKSLVTLYSISQLLPQPIDKLIDSQVTSSIQQQPYIVAFWNAVSEVITEWKVVLNHSQATSQDAEERFKLFKKQKKETFAYHSVTFKALNRIFLKLIPIAVKAKNNWWVKGKSEKSNENLKEWFKTKLKPLSDFNFYLVSDSPYLGTILRENDKGKVLTITPATKAVTNLYTELESLCLCFETSDQSDQQDKSRLTAVA